MGMLWKYEHTWPSGPDHRAVVSLLPQLQGVVRHTETIAHVGTQWTCASAVGEPDHLRLGSISHAG